MDGDDQWGKEKWDEYVDESATCRGHTITVRRRNLERQDGDWQDPNFFAEDYTVAAATGFQVWEGSYVVIKLLEGDLGDELRGKRVVELGSGTGLAGLCAAAAGAHVMLSDIATVTDESLRPNVDRSYDAQGSLPEGAWPGSGRVGEGSAACMAIDWTKGVDEQAKASGVDPCECDVVLAAECVWLADLVDPFVQTVLRLLRGRAGCVCYCVYRDRAKDESTTFAGMQMVVDRFEGSGCAVKLLQRLPPDLKKGPGNDVLVYTINLTR